jgi:hypothetical protein
MKTGINIKYMTTRFGKRGKTTTTEFEVQLKHHLMRGMMEMRNTKVNVAKINACKAHKIIFHGWQRMITVRN